MVVVTGRHRPLPRGVRDGTASARAAERGGVPADRRAAAAATGGVTDAWRFASIELEEPPKAAVRAWRTGDPVPRDRPCRAVEPRRQRRLGGTGRPRRGDACVAGSHVPGVTPELHRRRDTTRSTRRCGPTRTSSPRSRPAGITDLSLVMIEVWTYGQRADARAVAGPPAGLVRHLVPRHARRATPTPTRCPGSSSSST